MIDSFRWERIPLRNDAVRMPVLCFGALIAVSEATKIATDGALEAVRELIGNSENSRHRRSARGTTAFPSLNGEHHEDNSRRSHRHRRQSGGPRAGSEARDRPCRAKRR